MKKLLFVMTILTSLFACKKNGTENNQIIEEPIPFDLDSSTVVLNSNKINAIKEVHSNYIIISNQNLGNARNVNSGIKLEANDHFVCAPNSKMPKGLFEKVQSVTPYGIGDLRVDFFPFDPINPAAQITNAVISGSKDTSVNATNNVFEAKDESGNNLPFTITTGKLKIELNKKIDWDGNPNTKDSVEITGELKTDINLDCNLRIKDRELEKFNLTCKLTPKYKVNVKASLPLLDESKTFKFAEFYLTPITIPIGIFPIVLNPVVVINGKVTAKGEVFLEGSLIDYECNLMAGVNYSKENGYTYPYTKEVPPATFNPSLTGGFEGEVKVNADFLLQLRLYNQTNISVGLGLSPYVKCKLIAEIAAGTGSGITKDLNLTGHFGFEGKMEGTLKLFKKTIIDYTFGNQFLEIEIFNLKKFIQNWNPLNTSSALVAYYPFNGNTNDVSGNNNNGTINGGIVYSNDRFNVANKACSFNGSDAYIIVPPSATINSITRNTDATFTCWFKTDSWNNIGGHISKNNNANDLHYRFLINESSTLLQIEQPYGYANYSALNVNQWYHFAAVKLGNTAKFYIDGNLIHSVTMTDDVWASDFNTNLEIGRDAHGPVEYTRGVFDEIRIYKKALTTAEIIAIKNN